MCHKGPEELQIEAKSPVPRLPSSRVQGAVQTPPLVQKVFVHGTVLSTANTDLLSPCSPEADILIRGNRQ